MSAAVEKLTRMLAPMAADLQRREHDEADAKATAARSELATFDKDPASLRKLRVTRDAQRSALAQAELVVAVKKGELNEAEQAWHWASSDHSATLIRLRRESTPANKIAAARDALLTRVDQLHASRDAAAGNASVLLMKAGQFLNGLQDGCHDPIADLDLWLREKLAEADTVLRASQKEHAEIQREAAKAERRRKIFNT